MAILFELDFAIPPCNMDKLCISKVYCLFCQQVLSPKWNCVVLQCWWFASHEKKFSYYVWVMLKVV